MPAPLLLIRHAIAEDEHPAGDAARALTDDGREKCRDHLEEVAKLLHVKQIITSPLVRAVQTAEIAANAFGIRSVQVNDVLSPSPRATARTIALARELGGGHALVGHNPSITEVAEDLLGVKPLPFTFKKSGVLALME